MAVVNDRGQLLLVGAFALAVVFVGLTLVLTASNYTGTLATEGDELSQGGNAVEVRETVERDLESLLVHVNRGEASYSTREDAVRDTVPVVSRETGGYHAEHGRDVTVELGPTGTRFTRGVRIKQTSDMTQTSFRDPDDPAPTGTDWRVAGDTTLRNTTFVFDAVLQSTPSDAFTLLLEEPGGTDEWELVVFQDGADWRLRVTAPSGEAESCARPIPADDLTVDVDAATIDGDHCHALAFLDPELSSYHVQFENGLAARGQYWLTAEGTESAIGRTYGPRSDDVLYSTTVRFQYHSSTVGYETDLLIAPGELS